MNRKKQKDLLSEYAQIPNERAEDHLSGWKEKQVRLEKAPKEKRYVRYSFLRSPYFIGALVCIILISIILPVVLVYTKRTEESQESPHEMYYCSDAELQYNDIESLETFNEKNNCTVRAAKTDGTELMTTNKEVIFIETGETIAFFTEIMLYNGLYLDVDIVCYISDGYRIQALSDAFPEITVDGVNIHYSKDDDLFNYQLDFYLDGIEYYITANCFQNATIEIEDIFHRFF